MSVAPRVVGIDLGGTNVQIGIVSGEGRILGRARRKTQADEGPAAVIARLVEGVEEAAAAARCHLRDLAALGIGAPGAIDYRTGTVLEAPNLRWNNVPLARRLARATGLPVVVENDVNAAVYGENAFGAGRQSRSLLGVWVGTGIGGGLILDGRLFRGGFQTAGEIGHMTLFPGNPPGSRSLESICSRTAVFDRLVRLVRANHPSVLPRLVGGDLNRLGSEAVGRAYRLNDPLTRAVVDNAADLLGVAIASVVTLLSLSRVVLGGGLTEAIGRPWVARVARSVRAHVFPALCRRVGVVETALRDDAGVLGAALLAREHLASPGLPRSETSLAAHPRRGLRHAR